MVELKTCLVCDLLATSVGVCNVRDLVLSAIATGCVLHDNDETAAAANGALCEKHEQLLMLCYVAVRATLAASRGTLQRVTPRERAKQARLASQGFIPGPITRARMKGEERRR
jgi:hypothetical protein